MPATMSRSTRQLLQIVAVLAILVAIGVVAAFVLQRDPGAGVAASGGSAKATVTASRAGSPGGSSAVDPVSGLRWIDESALPVQAQRTLALIRAGGPYPYPRNDDQTFGNREGLLPKKSSGYYKEYTVETPGSDDRGARRIIAGAGGERYYTADHYQSFRRIREGS